MKTAVSGVPERVSRRQFLCAGVTALGSAFLGRPGAADLRGSAPDDARLSSRPGSPTLPPPRGQTALGLASPRDGLLYVPESYSADTPAPLFIALHGAGGAGRAWASYPQRAEARGMVLLAPDSRGSTWDLVHGTFGPDVAFLDRALEHTFRRCRIDPARIALGGFSDGASYALSLGVSNGDLFTHLVAFSPGFMRPSQPFVGKPRIYVTHGKDDRVLPWFGTRERIVRRLDDAGYDVTFRDFDGGHTVPSELSDAALDWFVRS